MSYFWEDPLVIDSPIVKEEPSDKGWQLRDSYYVGSILTHAEAKAFEQAAKEAGNREKWDFITLSKPSIYDINTWTWHIEHKLTHKAVQVRRKTIYKPTEKVVKVDFIYEN